MCYLPSVRSRVFIYLIYILSAILKLVDICKISKVVSWIVDSQEMFATIVISSKQFLLFKNVHAICSLKWSFKSIWLCMCACMCMCVSLSMHFLFLKDVQVSRRKLSVDIDISVTHKKGRTLLMDFRIGNYRLPDAPVCFPGEHYAHTCWLLLGSTGTLTNLHSIFGSDKNGIVPKHTGYWLYESGQSSTFSGPHM